MAPRIDSAHLHIMLRSLSNSNDWFKKIKNQLDGDSECVAQEGRPVLLLSMQLLCEQGDLAVRRKRIVKQRPSREGTSCSDSGAPLQPQRIGELLCWKAEIFGCPAAEPGEEVAAAQPLAP